MKRITAILLAVLMLVLSINVTSMAEGNAFTLAFKADKASVQRGDEITVSITVSDITDSSGIIGIDIIAKYDAAKLEPVKSEGIYPENWGNHGANFSPDPEKDEEGNYNGRWKLYFLYDGEEIGLGVRENDVFGISLKFKVKDDAAGGAAVVSVETNDLLSGTTDDLNCVFGKGGEYRIIVEAVEKLKLKETSSYKLEEAFVKGVSLGTDANTVISNFDNDVLEIKNKKDEPVAIDKNVSTGDIIYLLLEDKPVDSATIIVKGDTDGTGVIDATDYIIIKRHFLNISLMTGAYYAAADIDGNDTIDSTDYIAIKRHILGISLIK